MVTLAVQGLLWGAVLGVILGIIYEARLLAEWVSLWDSGTLVVGAGMSDTARRWLQTTYIDSCAVLRYTEPE